jgi:superfamily II RNA helicase
MSSFLKIADTGKGPSEMPVDPPITYGFPLDPFQQHAMKAICAEENVLVTAKTGSGKTLVGEIQIAHSLRKGKRIFYTTPIKSLSNQKFHDLKKQFGSVGIMTGDIKFSPDAQVVIMTTEILRNLLFKQNSVTRDLGPTAELTCDGLDSVIFDECHYINDRDRGHIWEEVMIMLPPEVKLILLSATLDHPEYFADWLGQLKQRPIHLISTEYRIVPLTHHLYYGNEFHVLMDAKNYYSRTVYEDWLRWRVNQDDKYQKFKQRVRDAVASGKDGPVSDKFQPTSFLYQMNQLILTLQAKELLPALFFVLSRKDCEKYAKKVEGSLITSSETAAVRHIWLFHLSRNRSSLEKLPQYHELFDLVQRGIAFHHSGLVPMLKEIVELLFGKGLIKVLFATETFAVGINMPTKTAVFVGLKKYDERLNSMRTLNTAEYLQMAGRAGRRGLDTMGTVIYFPDREPVFTSEMDSIMSGAKAPVDSRMEFGYDFILKSLQSGNRSWLELLESSYWKRQRDVYISEIELECQGLLEKLSALGISEEDMVEIQTKNAFEEQIRQNTNAKRRKAEACLKAWHDAHNSPHWLSVCAKEKEGSLLYGSILRIKQKISSAKNTCGDVENRIRILEAQGFLKPQADIHSHSSETLTIRGILATELNESKSLLISEFYLSPLGQRLEPQEILTVLCGCITEGSKEEQPALSTLDISEDVRESLYTLNDYWHSLTLAENKFNMKSTPWDLGTFWIEPLQQWMNGEPVGSICSTFGIYEGNLIRSVMKLNNMLEEWRCMAKFCEHSEMLNKFKDAEKLLIREVVIQDSLYLHL